MPFLAEHYPPSFHSTRGHYLLSIVLGSFIQSIAMLSVWLFLVFPEEYTRMGHPGFRTIITSLMFARQKLPRRCMVYVYHDDLI